MAASSSLLQLPKIKPSSQHYNFDPLPKSSRWALYHKLPSNPSLRLIRSSFSSNSFDFNGCDRTAHRRSVMVVHASSEKSSEDSAKNNRCFEKTNENNHRQLLHHFSLRMVLEVITFIWRLPGFFAKFFEKEDKLLDEVEEDIIKTADVIKGGAKVAEEVAEGLEEVAKGMERAAETIDKDAKKVDEIMDKMKEKTKIAHDEIEEVASELQGSVQDMEKNVTKVQIKVKGSKEVESSKEESTSDPPSKESPSSLSEISHPLTENQNNLAYKPFHVSILVWRLQNLFYGFFEGSQKWLHGNLHFDSLSNLMLLQRGLFGAMLMVSFLLGIATMANTPLANYAF